MTRKLTTSAADHGRTLADWLAARLGVDAAIARALIAGGAVFVDKQRASDPELLLVAGVRIAVHEAAPIASGGWVVRYESGDIVVVEKPAGMPSQATREARGALDDQVAARFPGSKLQHRLDRETSGLVLFTRTPDARRSVEGSLVREYLAVVAGVLERGRTIDVPLGRDPADPKRQRAGGGDPAQTVISVERRGAGRTLVRARLVTGRTHQIRVHLAHIGLPILGDPLYAPPPVAAAAPRLALHATLLAWPSGRVVSEFPAELDRLVK